MKKVSSMTLRHYGSGRFDRSLFVAISDVPAGHKPKGGLWTSPIDSNYGWRHFCDGENFGDCTEYFDVEFSGTILTIDTIQDLDKLIWKNFVQDQFVAFEEMAKIVDAIHLTADGADAVDCCEPRSLYGWDCETVLILNADAITTNLHNKENQNEQRRIQPEVWPRRST